MNNKKYRSHTNPIFINLKIYLKSLIYTSYISYYLCMIITIIHCLHPSNSIHQNNNLATNTRISRQHNLLCTEKLRTHFSSKLHRHHFIELWNNFDYNIQNLKPRQKFKYVLPNKYLSNYLNQVHCLNSRCVECN